MLRKSFSALAFAVALIATPCLATPTMTSSTPVAGSAAKKPGKIEISFSEAVAAKGAQIDLTMTGMPGMANHGAMKVGGFKTELTKGGKMLVALLARPLPPGSYRVDWKAGGAQGQFSFTVK